MKSALWVLVSSLAFGLPESRGTEGEDAWVLRAGEVHVGDGQVFRPGVVVVRGGKVLAVGPSVDVPSGAHELDLGEGAITPGLVDAACQVGTERRVGFAEQASEVIPHLSLADSVDFFSRDFERLVAGGVTTVYLTPEASSVLGSLGIAVKTAGPLSQRTLEARGMIKANLGPEGWRRGARNRGPSRFTSNFFARRPTTRMGSTWVFRKALYDARDYRDFGETDRDEAAMKALVDVLEGRVGLRFQAQESHDIQSAIRLTDEFGIPFLLEYGQEAYRLLDLLEQRKVPIVFGPIDAEPRHLPSSYRDGGTPCLTTPARLHERGIAFALTACDLLGEAGLARQAGLAVRFGLEREAALKAVTATPASFLGLGERVGTLRAGSDADLVGWGGVPLEDHSAIELVMISGHVVHDPKDLCE